MATSRLPFTVSGGSRCAPEATAVRATDSPRPRGPPARGRAWIAGQDAAGAPKDALVLRPADVSFAVLEHRLHPDAAAYGGALLLPPPPGAVLLPTDRLAGTAVGRVPQTPWPESTTAAAKAITPRLVFHATAKGAAFEPLTKNPVTALHNGLQACARFQKTDP